MPIIIENYSFDGPFAFTRKLKEREGVFAVLCLMENGKHFLIDVGEAGNVRGSIETHEGKECWAGNCKGQVMVAALYTQDLGREGRADIVSFIRSREFVPCEEKSGGS